MVTPIERLNLIRQKHGNRVCAECREENPEWCCLNRGVFLCITCAGIHRRLHGSMVRSCRLDSWKDHMVDSMAEKGNLKAKAKWEACVPPCWVAPSPNSRYVCKEQWIMAKYDRQQFMKVEGVCRKSSVASVKQGILYKRMKQSEVWNGRWFVLEDKQLSYYRSYHDRAAKTVIPLLHINVTLNGPGLESHPNSMLIAFWDEKSKKTRHIFVYAEIGKDIMDWFCAIRSAKIDLMRELIPELTVAEASQRASWEFSIWGYLCKTPPTQKKFQKRFFVLDKNSLRYYQTPYDPFPLGEIYLGPSVGGFWVDEDVPHRLQRYTNIFMLHTPARSNGGFPLLAEDSGSKMAWMTALQDTVRNNKRTTTVTTAVNTTDTVVGAQYTEHLHSYEEDDSGGMTTQQVTAVF